LIKVSHSKFIENQLIHNPGYLNNLKADFKKYKEGLGLPLTFGRDVPYDHMNTLSILKLEEVMHLHLGNFKSHVQQFRRTSNKAHLVYCAGVLETDHYFLIAILKPDAHALAKNRQYMIPIGQMAENFRNRY